MDPCSPTLPDPEQPVAVTINDEPERLRRFPVSDVGELSIRGDTWVEGLPVVPTKSIPERLMDALEVEPDSRVLEVGTGSGTTAATLASTVKEVFTMERLPPAVERTWACTIIP